MYDNFNSNQSLKSNEKLQNDAKIKYQNISEKYKQELLEKRKKFLSRLYIFLSVLFAFYAVIGGIPIVSAGDTDGAFLIVLFAGLSIFMLVKLYSKLNKTDKELILEQLVKELKKFYSKLTPENIERYTLYVKKYSKAYKALEGLNKEYSFDRNICKVHKEYKYCDNKRQFDNFDYKIWIYEYIENNDNFFHVVENVYEENKTRYIDYDNKYKKLAVYLTEDEVDKLELDYEIFNYIEKKLINSSKHSCITPPSVDLKIVYTSPSGRNRYENSFNFHYSKLLKYFAQKEELDREKEFKRQQKVEAENQKRKKEQRLRELDKLELKLEQKEKELQQREKEFLEATKDHIYTSDNIQKIERQIEDEMTISQKLKLLKEKFECGEITYEEYQERRKELI